MKSLNRLTPKLAMLLCAIASGLCGRDVLGQSDGSHPKIRFDAIHSNTWLETPPLPELTQYHLLHGLARASMALQQLGWECDVQIAPWNRKALEGIDGVVVNLCSADRPPFLISEIEAIQSYLEQGGGALFVTDHTNCYYHNHVLGALMDRLGIELQSDLACEMGPNAIGKGNGWIVASSFSNHPTVQGLRHIAFQSGGCVDRRFGIAFTSKSSWADWANIPPFGESNAPSFFGDYRKQPTEESGPLAIVAARSIGKGRVMIVADQNCLGGMFLNYADNRRLWLQGMRWIAGSTALHEEPLETSLMKPERERSLIWCAEPLSAQQYYFGNDGDAGLYNFYGWLNKIADARATDRPVPFAEVMVIPNPRLLKESEWLDAAISFLQHRDKTLIVLGTEEPAEAVEQFVARLQWSRHSLQSELLPARHAIWKGEQNQQLLYLSDLPTWTNGVLANPETFLNPYQKARLDATESWLIDRGLKRQARFQEGPSWLDEMDQTSPK